MAKFYCDGSTKKNGQPGQDSSYLVLCPDGTVIREHLGDFSINYAELYGIYKAATLAERGDEICTDSQIATWWATLNCSQKFLAETRKETIDLRFEVRKLVLEKNLMITKIYREVNKAGKIIEENPFYGSPRPVRLEKFKKERKPHVGIRKRCLEIVDKAIAQVEGGGNGRRLLIQVRDEIENLKKVRIGRENAS